MSTIWGTACQRCHAAASQCSLLSLYAEAWRQAFEESIQLWPPDGGIAPDASPEKRLKGYITSLLHRVTDPKSRDFDMVRREIAAPTGLLAEVMQRSVGPLHEYLTTIVREMMGLGASDEQVQFCTISIRAQCILPMHHRRLPGNQDAQACRLEVAPSRIGALAEHIYSFSLAGIRAIRNGAAEESDSATRNMQ